MTAFPELDAVLEDLVGHLREALGDNAIGAYLQGSLAIGDFDLTSDVDFVVVIRNDLSPDEMSRVQKIHTDIYRQGNRWVKRLEYSFFPVELLQAPTSPFVDGEHIGAKEREMWYFDNGSELIERSDHDNSLVVRWTLRERGVVLFGPMPTELIAPVPARALQVEIQQTLVGWGNMVIADPSVYQNRFYQSFLVLNYCRGLYDLSSGQIHSKRAGVAWALQNVDPTWVPLIEYCWKERQDPDIHVTQPAEDAVFKQTIEFVRYAVSRMCEPVPEVRN